MNDSSNQTFRFSPKKRALFELLLQETGVDSSPTETIRRRTSTDPCPLSFAQQRLWFLDQLEPGSAAYNMLAVLRIEGTLKIDALENSLNEIFRRHEALRTSFSKVAGEPVQVISPSLTLAVGVLDLSDKPENEREELARRVASEEGRRPFDLEQGPVIRANLLRLAGDYHVLLLTQHHIAADGWSVGVLIRELTSLYSAFSKGNPSPLEALPIQYADYAAWQRNWLRGEVLDGQLSYWKKQLAGLPMLRLPTDYPRPPVQTYRGASESLLLPQSLSERLKDLSRQHGVTLFMVLLAAFDVLLHRYTGQEDIVMGSPIANRNRTEIEGLIGFFVNSLVMRTDVSGDPSFTELLGRVREVCLAAYAHQDLPFEKLVEELEPERELSRNPLFQVTFALQNAPMPPLELGDLRLSLIWGETLATRFDLEAHVSEEGNNLRVRFVYSTDLFDVGTIRRMLDHFQTLLEAIVADPDRRISGLALLTEAEQHQLLIEWNETQRDWPGNKCIHQLFEEQAARNLDAIAVVFEDQRLTYGELNNRANQLAHYLRRLGVGPDALVGIYMERSVGMVIGLLGILKAGGAYVPLDPAYPKERLAFMLEDTRARVVLAENALLQDLPHGTARVVCLPQDWPEIVTESEENPQGDCTAENLAYVIYTSGSTGRPKGVEVPHRGVVRLLFGCEYAEFNSNQTFLHLAPISFDAATFEVWGALLHGARCVLFPGQVPGPREIGELLRKHGVTTLWLTASLYNMVIDEAPEAFSGVRQLLIGGEALSVPHVKRALSCLPSTQVINGYGPTESTTFTCCYRIPPQLDDGLHSIPIGRPISNTEVYILDRHMRPAPVGVAGELYIGGAGLVRGYLNGAELTAEKFIPHPFSAMRGARLYRSGDLARYLADGNIEFLGRIDNQVKIRGYRIELGEIETVLASHSAVREAAIAAWDEIENPKSEIQNSKSTGKRLVAYVVPELSPECDITDGSPQESWSDQQVAEWQELYEQTYQQPSPESSDPSFNITGWNSSYTGKPIPAEQMREWVDQTVERIKQFKPQRVLEIGCGTGLLLWRVAPGCDGYVATDFSQAALDHVQRLTAGHPKFSHVSLLRRMADDFSAIQSRSFDTVIINSVTQYLPSIDYLRRVLHGAVDAVAAGGRIFIGDVRSLALLRAFHTSVEFERAADSLRQRQLASRAAQSIDQERELAIDASFFYALRQVEPRISDVDVMIKRGAHHNELTRFRYDVVLHVQAEEEPARANRRLDWESEHLNVNALRELLSSAEVPALEVTGVPNARLATETGVLSWIAGEVEAENVGALRSDLASKDRRTIDPETLWRIGTEHNYRLELREAKTVGRLDALFRRVAEDHSSPVHWYREEQSEARPWHLYGNNPLRAKLVAGLVSGLRGYLKERLPEYMVPSAFVTLDVLPLTANGKVDQRALPAPDQSRRELQERYVSPRTPLEEVLAKIWSDVLSIDKVGIHDNFFDLGGDSILSIQIVARANEAGLRLTPKDVFSNQTVAELAAAAGPAVTVRADHEAVASGAAPMLAKCDQQQLDRVLHKLEKPEKGSAQLHPDEIEEIYPLSPTQRGMLAYSLFYPASSGVYHHQLCYTLLGDLDSSLFERTWQRIMARHSILRTAFLTEPVQVVKRHASPRLEFADWRGLSSIEQQERLKEFLKADRSRRFEISEPPLMRLALFRLSENRYQFIRSFHHVVMDGWSMSILWKDVVACYEALSQGREPDWKPAPHFRDYIAWLQQQQQKNSDAEAYWRALLKDFPSPTPLGANTSLRSSHGQEHKRGRLWAQLSREETARLQTFAREHRLTLNTLAQAAWGLVLSRHSGMPDVVFGCVMSVRPSTIPGIESMVGPLINILPVRLRLAPGHTVLTLLRNLHRQQVEMSQYDYSSPINVQEWSGVPRGRALFDSMFVFENYPENPIRGQGGSFEMHPDRSFGRPDSALAMAVVPGLELSVVIGFDVPRFDTATVARMLEDFRTLLGDIVANPGKRVMDLPLLIGVATEHAVE